MTDAQQDFLSQYSEMLHERRKLSKDCMLQEIKLAKLSGGIDSLEKLASRDHGSSQPQISAPSQLKNSEDNKLESMKELGMKFFYIFVIWFRLNFSLQAILINLMYSYFWVYLFN